MIPTLLDAREPLRLFLWRRYREHIEAMVAAILLLPIIDVPALEGLAPQTRDVVIYNTVVLGVVLGLLLLGRQRKHLRRYIVEGDRMTLPAWSNKVAGSIPLGSIAGVTLAPSSIRNLPGAVEIIVRSSLDNETTVLETDTIFFGLWNLDDLIMRLPPEVLAEGYTRSSRNRTRGG